MKLPHGVSVVVPVYNSQDSLRDLVARLGAVLPRLADRYEVIFVNDDSRDGSWAVIEGLAADHYWVRATSLMRNYGQHNALLCGIRAARFDVIVTMDDDLQHPPEEVPALLAELGSGFDVVYGTPAQQQHGLWRDLASELTKIALQSTMGVGTARRVSAFRAFRTQVRSAFASYSNPFVSIDVLLTWGTSRFSAIEVRHEPRRAGVSNYTFGKLVVHALNMITGFSTWPLQVASLLGFACTLLGIGVLVFVLGRYAIEGGSVPGFPFLASVIAIFSGAQLFAVGVIGEYLARLHFRSMERPVYTVRDSTDASVEHEILEPFESHV
jgi:glycosyltransferase involved in cell wall biosynthesis